MRQKNVAFKKFGRVLQRRSNLHDMLEQIDERVDSPLYDVQDNDILGYVHQFLRNFAPTRFIGSEGLSTREEALNALDWVERVRPTNSPQAKTARALRELISTAGELAEGRH